jgi:quinol monooxygenase YgiN
METIEKEILPLLRKQKGFLEEVVMTAPNQIETVAISLWEEKEYAEKFNREAYPEIVKLLNKYVEGIPVVKEYELKYATIPVFHKFAKAVTV